MLYKGLIAGLFGLLLVGCGGEPADTTNEPEATSTEAAVEPEVKEPEAVEEVKQDENVVSGAESVVASESDNWQYIVNNALRTVDAYAVQNNPSATFMGNERSLSLDKQAGGDYEGEYLLTIVNDIPGNVNYAQLRPLFDVNSSVDDLDDESELWEVVTAKQNGKAF